MVALGLALGMGCNRPEGEAELRAEEPKIVAPTRVELGGCGERPAEDRCQVVPEGRFTLWIELDPEAPAVLTLDDESLPSDEAEIQGGRRLTVTLPRTSGLLALRPRAGAIPWWSITLEPAPTIDGRIGAALRAEGIEAKIERLRVLIDGLDGLAQLQALRDLRILEYQRGEMAAVLELAEREWRVAGELGLPRSMIAVAHTAANLNIQSNGDLPAAARWLERSREAVARSPEDAGEQRRYEGLLARRQGDPKAATRAFEDAEHHAQRFGRDAQRAWALDDMGALQSDLGRMDLAMATAERALRIVPAAAPACSRPNVLANHAWNLVLAREAGVDLGDPRLLFDEADPLTARDSSCPGGLLGILLVNDTLAALQVHDLERARAQLRRLADLQVRGQALDGDLEAWRYELEHQLALAAGELDVRQLVTIDEQRHVLQAHDPTLRWFAATTKGRSLAARGRSREARAAFEQAEAMLDDQVLSVGLLEGADLWLQFQRRSAQHLVELLVQQGEHAEALCATRRARRRATWTIDRRARQFGLARREGSLQRWSEAVHRYQDQRRALEQARADDWRFVGPDRERRLEARREAERELRDSLDAAYGVLGTQGLATADDACGSLPAVEPGELLLAYFPLREGWVAFAATEAGVSAVALPELPWDDEAALARVMLDPFAAQIDAAEAIRVLPAERLWSVPVHALPWRDGVVLDHHAVSYGLDLSREPLDEPSRDRALVVADPSRTLVAARREIQLVSERLEAAGWQLLEARDARAEALRGALAEVDLLHYAGHGERTGIGGWDSALLLAESTTVGVADILAQPRVPRVAVLAGCQTGTADTTTIGGGMSLARAFLLAGAEVVIASTRDIDDDHAARMGAALYESLPAGAGFDGVERLRRAQLSLREAEPDSTTWRELRALVR